MWCNCPTLHSSVVPGPSCPPSTMHWPAFCPWVSAESHGMEPGSKHHCSWIPTASPCISSSFLSLDGGTTGHQRRNTGVVPVWGDDAHNCISSQHPDGCSYPELLLLWGWCPGTHLPEKLPDSSLRWLCHSHRSISTTVSCQGLTVVFSSLLSFYWEWGGLSTSPQAFWESSEWWSGGTICEGLADRETPQASSRFHMIAQGIALTPSTATSQAACMPSMLCPQKKNPC